MNPEHHQASASRSPNEAAMDCQGGKWMVVNKLRSCDCLVSWGCREWAMGLAGKMEEINNEAKADKEIEVAKESKDMTLSIMKEKYLSMVESEMGKAKLMVYDDLFMVKSEKGKEKLVVSDDMVEYVLAKYGNNWNNEDEIPDVILEDLRIKYGKYYKWKGKVDDLQNKVERLVGDLARAQKAKIKKLEEDFSRLL
uniref:Uncharacterized protein n=1 Tax=Tanacetum cinerariifolium TaxID=118510 RepID=A0A6L2LEH2_TANCI|nr:hypothetical protein [Tanacetum cinerariifolium]